MQFSNITFINPVAGTTTITDIKGNETSTNNPHVVLNYSKINGEYIDNTMAHPEITTRNKKQSNLPDKFN